MLALFRLFSNDLVQVKSWFWQTYGARSSLTTMTFWKNGVLDATIDAAICFFVPYYALRTSGLHSTSDVYSLGKTVFIALLGSVSLEVRKRLPLLGYLFNHRVSGNMALRPVMVTESQTSEVLSQSTVTKRGCRGVGTCLFVHLLQN